MKTGLYIFFLCCTLSLLVSCSEDTLGETGIGNITGVVVFEGDNAPQANVKISTNPPSNTVFTGEDGSFDLGEVVVGDYSVQAEKSDFITAFEPATVTEGSTTNVIFELQPETANNVAPSIPILVTPADEAEDVAQDVLFTWTVTDPDPFDELVYQLELRNDMTNEILNFQNLSDTFLSVNDLAFSTKYFWQVTVNDGINPDVNSEFSSFNTIDEPNNRLVFVRKESNGNNVIYSTDDGSETGLGPLALTSQSSNSFRPRRNTEVNKIAFLRTVGGETQLFTMNEDGSDVFQVTASQPVNGFNLEEVDFAWEPTGEKLYFPSFDKLFSINTDGGGLELVYTTPDGSFITEVERARFNDFFVIKTNNVSGYAAEILVLDLDGNLIETAVTGFQGALGGLDISITGSTIVFTRDISEFENPNYLQLDTRIFTYELGTGNAPVDQSGDKPAGTNDLDPRFTPTNAGIVYTNTPNDEVSVRDIVTSQLGDASRTTLVEDGAMPDWQ